MRSRTVLAFALAPLWVTAATALFAVQAFPYPAQRHWIIITTVIGTIFAYAGTIVLGAPAYWFLGSRNFRGPSVAIALGIGIGGLTWACFLFLFPISLGEGAAVAWQALTTNPAIWQSFLPACVLGSIVGITLWLIARPDLPSTPEP